MPPVQEIPVVPAAGTVVDHPLRLVRGLDARRLQYRGRCRQHPGTDGESVGIVLPRRLRHVPVLRRSFIGHIGEGEDRLIEAHDRAGRLPLPAGLHGLRIAPEAGQFLRVERIVNVHPLDRLRVVRRDGDEGHAVRRLEIQDKLRRPRHLESALQMLFKPKVLRDGVLVRVAMVEVRRNAETQAVIGHVAPVPSHVVDVGVEVVGWRQPQHRAGDPRDVGVVGDAGQFHGRELGFDAARQVGLALPAISPAPPHDGTAAFTRLSIPARSVVSLPPMECP